MYTKFHLYFWKNKAVIMRWAGHVARVGEHRNVCSGWWETQMNGVRLKDLSIDGRKILKLS